MDDVLVVGYGSDLRGDDAAGRRAVEAVASRGLPGVRVRSLVQLAPELAVDLTQCRLAIFVDASVVDDEVRVQPVEPVAPSWRTTHSVGPSALLALAGAVGSAPPAVLVTIPATELPLRMSLSPPTARAVPVAVERIVELCTRHRPEASRPVS